jgi:peptide deformylase
MSEVEDIICYGHPVLRGKAAPVRKINSNVERIIERMSASLEAAGGLGLAAPQIGSSVRVVVYDIGEGPCALINPQVRENKGMEVGVEGCLSLPRLYGDVSRATHVVVKGRDLSGQPVTIEAEDLLARVLQHEIDHLDGILFIDRVNPETLHWLVAEGGQEGEPQRVYTTLADALKIFEARMACRRGAPD